MHFPSLFMALAAVTPVFAKLPNFKIADCDDSVSYDDLEDKATFWYQSGAEQYADAYIKARGSHEDWVQDLYREIFGGNDMDCSNSAAACNFKATCADFNKKNLGGLYYLFDSATKFHSFIGGLHEAFEEKVFIASKNISVVGMRENINLPDDTQSDDAAPVLGFLSSALGFTSTFDKLSPPSAAVIESLQGVVDITSQLNEAGQDNPPKYGDAKEEALKSIIAAMAQQTYDALDKISYAVFGAAGHSQDDVPKAMRIGRVNNPAVSIFGGGYWLQDHPTQELDSYFERLQEVISQALIWQLIRKFKGAVVVIRDDLKSADKCQNANNGWRAENSECYDLMWHTDKSIEGQPDFDNIWQEYNMDQLATMKNAVDCWFNNGRAADVTTESTLFDGGDPGKIPDCFFSIDVVRGSWVGGTVFKGSHINLNPTWKGQEKGGYFPQ